MGAFLDKPKTEKTNLSGEGNGISYGMSSMQGWRMNMEDAHIAETAMSQDPPYKNWSFFAVFDGHAGPEVAAKASNQLLQYLIDTKEFKEMTKALKKSDGVLTPECLDFIVKGIRTGFLNFDECTKNTTDCSNSGSTAVCAIITPSHTIIGNLGDSRAVLSSKNTGVFGTTDHKPYHDKEKQRIVGAGGQVMIQRINGTLAVSRAFGDYQYKDHPLLPAHHQLVSPEPDTYIRPRCDDTDEFLVLACDGVYDVMENDELAQFVRGRLAVHTDLTQVCNDVLDECLAKGSRDNMTVVIVKFPAAPTIDATRQELETRWTNDVNELIQEYVENMMSSENFDNDDLVNTQLIIQDIQANERYQPLAGIPTHSLRTLITKVRI
ncbi:unnamed protein product [Caenorhabditis bovis]|uniref:PPM-type phosphatase domain-containing protein n=1 Tax=Caenorhabditis bovis TaxID=2654633 RepID=A0A8S1E8A7_9PELO|nr:unnamed protein product [Caenorhabditis bovis]